jgi:DNA-binding winged helix-turn-helix (wHTH) protein/tetratricopeptide (TPR) repeat protein
MLTRTGETTQPINLAHIAPFRLGNVDVHPATRQLLREGASETIEPRVMQVLVALAQANGAVVTRDELTDLCWEGRIVSENAINRVISRVRQIASDFACGSFELETITKVGYRIVPTAPGAAEAPDGEPLPPQEQGPGSDATRISRRGLIGAGVVGCLALAGGGYWVWAEGRRHQPPAEARALYERGLIAQRQGQPEQTRAAVAFLKQATDIDPLYSDAWGALSLAYRHVLEGNASGEVAGLPGLIRSAAERALSLDPDNADARLALIIIKPNYRNWLSIERDLVPLGERYPDHWFIQAQLGILRYDVGRWRDGLPHTRRQLEIEPFLPVAHANLARALWSAGRLQEAEEVLDRALERWPGNYVIWNSRFQFLLLTGRPGAAIAAIMNPEQLPEQLRPNAVEARTTLARALEFGRQEDVAASLADLDQQAKAGGNTILGIAPFYVRLGRAESALNGLDAFYFGGTDEAAQVIAPPGRYDRRPTFSLFTPPMAPLWRERRFAGLLERTGLERYWRETGTVPDFRRT